MELINTLLPGVIASLIAAFILSGFKNLRKRSLQKKIAELDLEKEFLNKISKGNINLLRSSFIMLFFLFGACFFAIGLFFANYYYPFPELIKRSIILISSTFLLGLGAASVMHAFTLKKLNNLSETKAALNKKREKLKKKIEG